MGHINGPMGLEEKVGLFLIGEGGLFYFCEACPFFFFSKGAPVRREGTFFAFISFNCECDFSSPVVRQ